ncbi:unnamed protein product [Amoebophrya sp. A25]|nr:unnamed protein product [Amoebophrya sp. A25]|eukprot:GSA25T00016832001.1
MILALGHSGVGSESTRVVRTRLRAINQGCNNDTLRNVSGFQWQSFRRASTTKIHKEKIVMFHCSFADVSALVRALVASAALPLVLLNPIAQQY